jgi:predicted  nucleic acid-binding Zn-ribbon protein
MLTSELQAAAEERETLEATVALLTKRLAEAQAERDDTLDEKDSIQARLRRTQDELEAVREDLQDMQEKRNGLAAKLAAKVIPIFHPFLKLYFILQFEKARCFQFFHENQIIVYSYNSMKFQRKMNKINRKMH